MERARVDRMKSTDKQMLWCNLIFSLIPPPLSCVLTESIRTHGNTFTTDNFSMLLSFLSFFPHKHTHAFGHFQLAYLQPVFYISHICPSAFYSISAPLSFEFHFSIPLSFFLSLFLFFLVCRMPLCGNTCGRPGVSRPCFMCVSACFN